MFLHKVNFSVEVEEIEGQRNQIRKKLISLVFIGLNIFLLQHENMLAKHFKYMVSFCIFYQRILNRF